MKQRIPPGEQEPCGSSQQLEPAQSRIYTFVDLGRPSACPPWLLNVGLTLAGGAELRAFRRPPPREVFVENFHRRQARHRSDVCGL